MFPATSLQKLSMSVPVAFTKSCIQIFALLKYGFFTPYNIPHVLNITIHFLFQIRVNILAGVLKHKALKEARPLVFQREPARNDGCSVRTLGSGWLQGSLVQ